MIVCLTGVVVEDGVVQGRVIHPFPLVEYTTITVYLHLDNDIPLLHREGKPLHQSYDPLPNPLTLLANERYRSMIQCRFKVA